METSYENFDGNANEPRKINKLILGSLIITCILLIAVSIIAIVYGIKWHNESSGESNKIEYCTTPECLQLAAEVSQTINTSVDPCNDFYHYVCDGWVDDNSWINVDYSGYNRFYVVANMEKQTFLDELFYNTKPELVDYTAVQKATAFFQTCYDSTDDTETEGSAQFVTQLLNQTLFASTENQWDSATIEKFQSVLTYLTQINFNSFFILEAQSTKLPKFVQNYGFWSEFDAFQNTSQFIPYYKDILRFDNDTSEFYANAVRQFAFDLRNISTVEAYQNLYSLPSYLQLLSVTDALSNISVKFASNEVLNYAQLVYDAYGISDTDTEMTQFQYYSFGVPYFKQLASVIKSEDPMTVQVYVWTTILYYYLDFGQIFSQTRYTQRSDFCFQRTITAFPFVYGYILFNKLYDDDTYELATTLANTIKTQGTQALISNATWLDSESKAAALKKIENMALYIGFPPKIKSGDNIDIYYKEAQQSMSASWISNVESFTKFAFKQFNDTFWGNQFNLIEGWPSDFSVPEQYSGWLTGINAFYMSLGNFFTIPVTISQPPFVSSSEGYPSAMIFGGLGGVTGHEMSHGFDPSGSQFDYSGNYVGSIFTNYSKDLYSAKMQCFINQYDNIAVDQVNGTIIYVNGSFTITENVADNAGVMSSWTAWRKYIAQNGKDKLLHGISLTQEQLFFVGWASLWCDSSRKGSVVIDGDIHSPNYARVIGPLQNNPHFAKAFSCDSGTRMNPKEKCIVW